MEWKIGNLVILLYIFKIEINLYHLGAPNALKVIKISHFCKHLFLRVLEVPQALNCFQ